MDGNVVVDRGVSSWKEVSVGKQNEPQEAHTLTMSNGQHSWVCPPAQLEIDASH